MSKPHSKDCAHVSEWLQYKFVQFFKTEADPSRWPIAGDTGSLAITLLCLTYCTAAAGLVNGTNEASTTMCIEFIRRRFKNSPEPSGARYEKRADVLYTVYRHGLVHQFVPGMIDLEDGTTLGWALFRDKNRDAHLLLVPSGMVPTATGLPDGHHRLYVQPDVLYEDSVRVFQDIQLESAVDKGLAQTIYDGAAMAADKRKLGGRPESKSRARTLAQLQNAVAGHDPGDAGWLWP